MLGHCAANMVVSDTEFHLLEHHPAEMHFRDLTARPLARVSFICQTPGVFNKARSDETLLNSLTVCLQDRLDAPVGSFNLAATERRKQRYFVPPFFPKGIQVMRSNMQKSVVYVRLRATSVSIKYPVTYREHCLRIYAYSVRKYWNRFDISREFYSFANTAKLVALVSQPLLERRYFPQEKKKKTSKSS